jgi:diguanylate cyclase (GGDEF)-like protein
MPGWSAILLATALASRPGLVAFQRVPVPDDVPAHLCTAIAQDRQGLMWFGSQRGLVRYDGYQFRVFRSDPADRTTLGGNYVRSLLVARDGRLWVGTFSGGLSMFDPRTETFTRFPSIPYDRVEGLAEDREGRIWVATTAGLDRLDPATGSVQRFLNARVRGLLVDRRGRVWAGSGDGLQRQSDDGRRFERVAPQLAGNAFRLFEDRAGLIWIGSEDHGAAVYDPSTGTLRRIDGLSHFWVYGFAEGVPGEIWVATFGGGIDIVDARSLQIIERLRRDATLPDTIGADRLGAIFRDREGVMWAGTWGEGIARHDPRTRAFRTLRFSPARPDGITHAAAVRALEMHDGTIWVGTNGNGIDVFDRALRRVGGIRAKLSDGAVTCIAQSRNGDAWVATLDGSLHRKRVSSPSFERIAADRLPGGPIRTIAFDAAGILWAGAARGMARIDPRTLETRLYRQWTGAGNASPAIEAIVVAANGTLWVGTDNGLYSFDPRDASMVRIAKDSARADGLPDNWIPDLMLASDGRLWVGTASGACVLRSWDGKVARFDAVASKLRRAPAPAEALIEDAAGQVWVGPRLRVDPRTWTARDFGPEEGCTFRNFFIASRTRTRDGVLLFGSPEGLLLVDPASLPARRTQTSVVATAIRVEGAARAGAAVLPRLDLSAAERSFTVDVSALDFGAPLRQVYRHRMDGLDRDWTVLGSLQHSLTYSRLPPGQYTLRVGVADGDGRWSASELRLPITVAPAVYQTMGFRAAMAALAAAVLYAAYLLRVRQLRARQRTLERVVDERTRELADAYQRIEQASLTDPLTGLRNRRFLEQNIGADLELASRGHGDLVVLLADLDHFKSVNDTYGHAAGDAVLEQLADVLRTTFRTSDYLVRWGGEEFLVVVRFVERASAPDLAEKLRAAVEAHPFLLPDGTVLRRTCSVGFASWPAGSATFEQIVDRADAALYAAKRGGRNACVAAETLVA